MCRGSGRFGGRSETFPREAQSGAEGKYAAGTSQRLLFCFVSVLVRYSAQTFMYV